MTRRLPFFQAPASLQKSLLPLSITLLIAGNASAQQQPWIAGTVQDAQSATTFEGEHLTGRPDREVKLECEVEIVRGQTQINADVVNFDIVDDRVDANGNVHIVKDGNQFDGTELKLKLDTGVGFMNSTVYRLLQRNAHGNAERIDFESEDVATIIKGYYTTCNGSDPDWYLKASKLTLDEGAGTGYAKNAVLIFKGVPIAGTPRISFPLTDERASGFLAPTVTSSTGSGLQVTTPYYWNIAPNRDMTLFPRYMTTRGLMLGADFRYLEPDFSGETRLEFMNDTNTTTTRYGISARHNQVLAPGLTLTTDLNAASDNNYAVDFPFSHVWDRPGIDRRLLPQSASLNYASNGWNGSFQLFNYQLLQDANAPITVPYSRLPQITLNNFSYTDSGFDWTMNSQFTRFSHPTLVQGDRLVFNPRVTYNALQGAGYFVRPSFSVHGTFYNLDHISDSAMTAPERILPTFSLDSGLIFERDSSFFGREAIQTLEPRLFYTYTPYKAQNSNLYPNFDTSEADISYAQVFRENRFVGNDRIGDANQVTLAMTSRYFETNGAERLRMAIAQRFNITNPLVGVGAFEQTSGEARSDVLLLTSGRISKEMRMDVNLQYSQSLREVTRMNAGVFWQPEPLKVLNVQYRRDSRNLPADIFPNTNFELIDVSTQWPLGNRWYGVARLNYLLDEKRVGQSLAGLEYMADCWIFRMVAQKLPTAAGVTNTTIFFQLELNGLSSVGMNPLKAIRGNVPGYQPLTQPQ